MQNADSKQTLDESVNRTQRLAFNTILSLALISLAVHLFFAMLGTQKINKTEPEPMQCMFSRVIYINS